MDKMDADVVPENRSIADWEWYEAHGDEQAIEYMNAYRKAFYGGDDPCRNFAKRGAEMTKNFLNCYGRSEVKGIGIKFFSEAGEIKTAEISFPEPPEKGKTYYFHYQGPGQQVPLKSTYDYPRDPLTEAMEKKYSETKIRLSAATYPITTQSLNVLIDKINELEDRLEKLEK